MKKYQRVIVVSDVHGCLTELNELLEKISYNSTQDRLILAGDLVDRGPDSIGVIRLAMELKAECVLGNHDELHLRYFKYKLKKEQNPKFKIPMRYLGDHKMQIQNSLTMKDFEYLASMSPYILLENNWVIVHAGLQPNKSLEEQDDRVTHIRFINPETFKAVSLDENYQPPPGSVYWTDVYSGPYNVIYGHNVHSLEAPEIREVAPGIKTVGIDTGCCFGGNLCAAILENNNLSFVMVRAHKNYWTVKGNSND